MTHASYVARAYARLKSKGPLNTAAYAGHVIRENILAAAMDVRFGGKLCRDNVDETIYCNGRHTMEHCHYHVLRDIFSEVPIAPDDVLVDVGCGEGRVINFWLSRRLKNPIVGIEAVESVARNAQARYRKYDNVTILHGDALEIVPSHGTLFFLNSPFSEESVARFERLVRPLRPRLVYSHNLYMRSFLANGWRVKPIHSDGRIYEFQAALIEAPPAMSATGTHGGAAAAEAARASYRARNAVPSDSVSGPMR